MTTPIEATVTQWAAGDGVGRLKLSTGEDVRFGASACPFPPTVGLVVQVLALGPHPLGGRRATAIELPAGANVDALFDAAGAAPGLLANDSFIELTDDVGLLGVVLKEPLTTREQLRRWLERFDATVDFSDPRATVVTLEGTPYRVWRCMGELAGGRGVMTFARHEPFSLEKLREQALASVSLGHRARVEALTHHEALARYVSRCAPGEVAVIAHQARGFLAEPAAWVARRQQEPLDGWVWQTRSRGGDLVMSGFRALELPDVFWSGGDSPERLHAAACALVELGRRPNPGESLGPLTVNTSDDAWVGFRG